MKATPFFCRASSLAHSMLSTSAPIRYAKHFHKGVSSSQSLPLYFNSLLSHMYLNEFNFGKPFMNS